MGAGVVRRGLIVAGAMAQAGCATADLRPGIVRHETPRQIWSRFHGPDVNIRTSIVATRNSRMVQPIVTLGDSAYIVIGDIGDDGSLRIVYPMRPGEPNLVRKIRWFEAPQFQPRVVLPYMQTAFATARTAPGFAFVIASSVPLQLDKLAEGERWSIFDVYYDNYTNDPRPAITDLAAAISTSVGDISIAYAPYASGMVGSRADAAPRATPIEARRRLPRPPRQQGGGRRMSP